MNIWGVLLALVVVQDYCWYFLGEDILSSDFSWLFAALFQVCFALSHLTVDTMAVFVSLGLEEDSSPLLFDGELQFRVLEFEQELPDE